MKQIPDGVDSYSDFIYNYAGKRAKGKDTNSRKTPERRGKSHVRSFFFSSSYGKISNFFEVLSA